MQKFCLACDLKEDEDLIAEYEKFHAAVWPEIQQSILDSGITLLDIYRVSNRLFMILEATDDFSFEKKSAAEEGNAKVQEWEELMWKFQQALPWAEPGQKWMLMEKIFQLP